MKILLGVDGSQCSDAAIEETASKLLPSGSEVRVVSVIEPIPQATAPNWAMPETYYQQMEDFAESRANQVVINAVERLKTAATKDLNVSTSIVRGLPKEALIDEADQWNADLIVVGSHGYHGLTRFLIGSVSQAVASHAHCSVEIVRCRRAPSQEKKTGS